MADLWASQIAYFQKLSKIGEVLLIDFSYPVSMRHCAKRNRKTEFYEFLKERSLHMPELQTLLTGLAFGGSSR